jgi:hypothetical protein
LLRKILKCRKWEYLHIWRYCIESYRSTWLWQFVYRKEFAKNIFLVSDVSNRDIKEWGH